jgi:predicted nucleotidyltransferase
MYDFRQLDAAENEARLTMLRDIEDAVLNQLPMARIQLFGSFPVGLSTFLSDVDVSITNVLSAEQRQHDEEMETIEEDNSGSMLEGEDSGTEGTEVDVGGAGTETEYSGEEVSWCVDATPSVAGGIDAQQHDAPRSSLTVPIVLSNNSLEVSDGAYRSGAANSAYASTARVARGAEENGDDRIMKVVYLEEIFAALQVMHGCILMGLF